jgi:hypothetical protein
MCHWLTRNQELACTSTSQRCGTARGSCREVEPPSANVCISPAESQVAGSRDRFGESSFLPLRKNEMHHTPRFAKRGFRRLPSTYNPASVVWARHDSATRRCCESNLTTIFPDCRARGALHGPSSDVSAQITSSHCLSGPMHLSHRAHS